MAENPFDEIPISDAETSQEMSTAKEILEGGVWRRDSVVVVIGTLNRGKSTTMNIFTGNQADARGGAGATTTETKLYSDLIHRNEEPATTCGCRKKESHSGFPLWLDTIGLHEAKRVRSRDQEAVSTESLVQEYLKVLYDNGINYVHAVIWCMTPEEAHTQALEEEADAIQFLLRNCERQSSIGANILILVKQPRDPLGPESSDVQGALECLPTSWRSLIQFEGYELRKEDDKKRPQRDSAISVEEARRKLEVKLAAIKEPLQLRWKYSVCLDCGQTGDDRLFENTCHYRQKEDDRFKGSKFAVCLNKLLCCCNKRIVCEHCDQPWPLMRNGSVEVLSKRCVQISDYDNLKSGYTRCSDNKQHNLQELNQKNKVKLERKRMKEAKKMAESC